MRSNSVASTRSSTSNLRVSTCPTTVDSGLTSILCLFGSSKDEILKNVKHAFALEGINEMLNNQVKQLTQELEDTKRTVYQLNYELELLRSQTNQNIVSTPKRSPKPNRSYLYVNYQLTFVF